jgi:hypothetical protein
MCGDNALCSSAALINSEYPAKFAANFSMKRRRGAEGSNPLCSTFQSLGFRTSRRIDRKARVRARFAIARGPRERLGRHKSAESSKTYPGPILLGPHIIAIHSPAISERQIGRSTSTDARQQRISPFVYGSDGNSYPQERHPQPRCLQMAGATATNFDKAIARGTCVSSRA